MQTLGESISQIINFLLANSYEKSTILFIPVGETKVNPLLISELEEQLQLEQLSEENELNVLFLSEGISSPDSQKNIRKIKDVILIIQEQVVKVSDIKDINEKISNLNGEILGAIYVSKK